MTKQEICSKIDHTNLKPEATEKDIEKLCKEAMEYGFYSVCVNPNYVEFAKECLKNSEVKVVAVVGFPLGENLPEIKSLEAMLAKQSGADEIDMVVSISAIKNKDWDYVYSEIMQIVDDVKIPVKVILEICKLSDDEIEMACEVCEKAGASFVKTSTGFASSGATEEAVRLMKKSVKNIKVKAAGGIKTLNDAIIMFSAGADRIGTSNSVKIISEII